MVITLPAVPVTGTTIDTSWGIDVRTALDDLQTQVTAIPTGPAGFHMEGVDSTEHTTTSTTMVTLSTLSVSIGAAKHFDIRIPFRKTSGASASASIGLKLNSTEVTAPSAVTAVANSDDSGLVIYRVGPRVANYLYSAQWDYSSLSLSGNAINITNAMPAATITSIIIEGLVGSASITLAVQNVEAWSFP